MFRRTFALLFSAVLCAWPTAAQLAPDNLPRQEITILNFEARGWILDLGGGCRGTIGRLKPDQVVAIDISHVYAAINSSEGVCRGISRTAARRMLAYLGCRGAGSLRRAGG